MRPPRDRSELQPCLTRARRSPSSSTAPTSTPPRSRSASTSTTSGCWTSSRAKGYLLRAYYYTALAEDQEYSSIRPLIDWLDYNGYTVVTKPTKEFVDATGRRKIKGNMDIELAVDVMEMAEHVDHFVLFSGDGDFRSLVEAVQRKGRKVTVVSTLPDPAADDRRRTAPPGRPLRRPRRACRAEVGRDPAERAQRAGRAPAAATPSRTSSRTTKSSDRP